MSKSHELQLHIAQMQEIRTILNSMKNLAFIEIHKLSRFQTTQSLATANIERAAADFLNFYPCMPAVGDGAPPVCIIVGSERGFCGDFNELLFGAIGTQAFAGIILIGNRLINRVPDTVPEILTSFAGANTAEEIPIILIRLINAISALQKTRETQALTVIYHESNGIVQKQLLPPFIPQQPPTPKYLNPPVLNLEPEQFFSELVDHYLFAVLHEIFYLSLMAENHRRMQHLEAAVRHLDKETVNLRRKSQIYRQEEITEEIEVILLNADNL